MIMLILNIDFNHNGIGLHCTGIFNPVLLSAIFALILLCLFFSLKDPEQSRC